MPVKILGWLTGVPLAVIATAFSVANRDAVRLDLWPLPYSVDIPIYVTVMGSVVLGVLVGWAASLGASSRIRSRLRESNAKVQDLERRLPPPAS